MLAQVRFALKFISGAKKLPSKSEMMKDTQIQSQIHWNQGYRRHRTHVFGLEEKDYLKQITEIADIERMPEVLVDIGFDSINESRNHPTEFRKYKYTIMDDKTFRKEKYEN